MRRERRMPKVGDVIIERCSRSKKDCPGTVYEICLDTWGHQRNVFIHWASSSPVDYNPKHGYAGVNIHNLRDRFIMIRRGVEIP